MLIISQQCILSVRKINRASSGCNKATWNHIGPCCSAPWYSVPFAIFFFSLSLAPSVFWASCAAQFVELHLIHGRVQWDGQGWWCSWLGWAVPKGRPSLSCRFVALWESLPLQRTTGWLWTGQAMQALPELFIAVRGREAACSSAACFSCFRLAWLASFWHVWTGFHCAVLCLIEERGKLASGVLFSSRFFNPRLAIAADCTRLSAVGGGREEACGRRERREGCCRHTACSSQGINTEFVSQAPCSKALKTHLDLACGRTPKMPWNEVHGLMFL